MLMNLKCFKSLIFNDLKQDNYCFNDSLAMI